MESRRGGDEKRYLSAHALLFDFASCCLLHREAEKKRQMERDLLAKQMEDLVDSS